MITFFLSLFFLLCAVGMINYWLPYAAFRKAKTSGAPEKALEFYPRLVVVGACHNGASSIGGLIQCVKNQDYPADKIHFIVLLDNCTDASKEIAQKAGVDVFERNDIRRFGKGHALNELLQRRLKEERFDAVVFFDVDSRFDSGFFKRVGAHFLQGNSVIQGLPYSQNPEHNALTSIGDATQALLRLHQKGRAALGLPPILMGGYGLAIGRAALDRLGWRVGEGNSADDLELGLRCFLFGIPMTLAPDLNVYHELPDTVRSIRVQKRRWTCNSLRCLPVYGGALLKSLFRGRWLALDALCGVLLLPSYSTLLILLFCSTVGLTIVSFRKPHVWAWAGLSLTLFVTHVVFILEALRSAGARPSYRMVRGTAGYIFAKMASLLESPFLVRTKAWWPTPHRGDSELGFRVPIKNERSHDTE